MPLHRVRPLDEIYADISDYDRVLVPNNPLAEALNRRVDTPQLGTVATTPRRLATGRRETAEDRTAFLEVIRHTDHPWKAVAYAVGNVLQCWEHEGTAEAILEYPQYVDETTRDVLEIVTDLRTTSGELTSHEIPAELSVAVLGAEQFTPLERSIVPAHADRVDLFAAEPFDRPPFHVFETPGEIVEAVLDTVSEGTADDVAIVLDSGSRYSSLIESALEAAGIPFYGGPGFADDPDHRAVLRLLGLVERGSETTVGEVRPICARVGIDVPIEHEEKRLAAPGIEEIAWIADLAASLSEHTFAHALDTYETRAGRELAALREELQALGLLEARVTAGRVRDLAYYLQSYEVPVERENEGVLLADATNAGYVDRPAVFFLGMDEDWTHAAPERPWVDPEALSDRHLAQFQLLLQSGTDQYYLVQDAAGGEPVTPCLYFGEVLEGSVERFTDLDHVEHDRVAGDRAGGFDREPIDVEEAPIDTISQSSLNRYVNSPREYLFDRLLDGPDRDYFREGTLFHDFAEFYVNHPEVIGEDEITELVALMLDAIDDFLTEIETPLRRRTYRIGLETIAEYLDEHAPEDDTFLTPASGWGQNAVAEHFEEPVDSPLTERWFENTAIGAKGMIDLVRAPDHLLDYKSSAKRSARQVRKAAAIDPPADTPNFQAALYLSHFRTVRPDQRIDFTFFHFLEPLPEVVAGDADLDDALTTITYHPQPFQAYLTTRGAFDELLDGYKDCAETFEDLGFEAYREIVADLSFPETTDREELRDSEFAAQFTAAVERETAADLDATKGADQAIRALNGVRKRAFFEGDLDAFEAFLREHREAINRYRCGEGRFPIDGPGGEPNYRRVDHRDLLLEGDR